jgi:sec-independent protein translocase protein TatA
MEIFSPGHLIPLLAVAAILFFGWKQLPDMAKSVGKSLRVFKTEMKGMSDDDDARKVQAVEPAPVPPVDKAAGPSGVEDVKPGSEAVKPSSE